MSSMKRVWIIGVPLFLAGIAINTPYISNALTAIKEIVIVDTVVDSEELEFEIPDYLPPGNHELIVEVTNEDGSMDKINVKICKLDNSEILFDTNC